MNTNLRDATNISSCDLQCAKKNMPVAYVRQCSHTERNQFEGASRTKKSRFGEIRMLPEEGCERLGAEIFSATLPLARSRKDRSMSHWKNKQLHTMVDRFRE